MPTRIGYRVHGNLSEKQIEADVATFMGWCSPPEYPLPFRLLDADEQATGADKIFDRGLVIYMQFKKSAGLMPVSKVPLTKRGGPLEAIRKFRSERDLEDDLTLYFQLRAKAKHAADLQHNVMLRQGQQPGSRCIYVAPLLLDKDRYQDVLFTSADRFLHDPFRYYLSEPVHLSRTITYLRAVPFLREHVSIPPHVAVSDHNHYYAYSETGTDISWHSPEVVDRRVNRLSDFLADTLEFALDSVENTPLLPQLAAEVLAVSDEFGFRVDGRFESPLDLIRAYGGWLRSLYDIRQFVLLVNSEDVVRLRGYR